MKIRKYNTSDYSTLLEIYAASKLDEFLYEEAQFDLLPLDKDLTRHAKLLESDIYLYEDGDKNVAGYCAKFACEIRALFVHPKSRGKGIGKRMLQFLLANIPGTVVLYVARSNRTAKNLYTQFGFQVVEEFATTYNGIPVFANKMMCFQEND